ncbi:MAG: endonuclease III domain-containing protein [Candidatus Thorarchaeota archaeon]
MTVLDPRAKAEEVCRRIRQNYGDAIASRHLPPVDELVLTILSQNTNDVNSGRAFESLRSKFPTWEDVLAAPESEVAQAIRVSGAYHVKAKRIKSTLAEIQKRVGRIDLSLLEHMPINEAKEWLSSLHGVGPKTAAIVLLFSFHRPVLPVDTHVWRISRRLGLIGDHVSREKAHSVLQDLLPPSCVFHLNHNLVRHGRSVCRSQRPRCDVCFLSDLCDYAEQMS